MLWGGGTHQFLIVLLAMLGPIITFIWDAFLVYRYLFPEEREYESWFSKAGFTDIKIHQVTPEWYNGDRSHGLIMGCAIVGTKPDDWAQPERKVRPLRRQSDPPFPPFPPVPPPPVLGLMRL